MDYQDLSRGIGSKANSKGIATSKHHLCPICQKDHGCLISYSGNVVTCLRADSQWIINDWKYRKQAHGGMGSVWGIDSENPNKTEYRPQPQVKQSNIKPLIDEQLDREARKIIKQLGLSEKHREELKQRGFTDEQINKIGFRSVERYQQFNLIPISKSFPGINYWGNLTNSDSGYLIPCRNSKGLIVGFQIANDHRGELDKNGDKIPKYQHLTGCSKRRVSGERPLQFLKVNDDKDLNIAEATLKPLIAAYKHNINVLGEGGCQWASSPDELTRIVKLGLFDRYILNPDAGSKLNHHVLGGYRALFLFLKNLGITLYVRDWGQGEQSKSEGSDVDEIDTETFNNARIIPYQEWDTEFIVDVNYKESLVEPTGVEKTINDDWLEAARKHWKRHKKFTPTTTQKQEHTAFRFPKDGESLFVKGGMGTGKTHQISININDLPEDKGVICLFATNALAYQFCERTGVKHLHRDNAFDELKKPNGRIALCTNSLPHFWKEWFDNKLVIIDESVTVSNHILASSTHVKNRKECLILLSECLRRASSRIFLDGNCADWLEDYLIGLIGNHPIIKLENLHQNQKPSVEFLLGAEQMKKLPDGTYYKDIKPTDNSPFIPAIIASEYFGIITDSQAACEAWEDILTNNYGKRGIRVDSLTITEKNHPAKNFIANPDLWIEENRPEFVILSPTAKCGIDISIRDYFTDVFSFFCGVLTTDDQLQFIGRFRDPNINHHVYCKPFTIKNDPINGSYFSSTIKRKTNDYLLQDIDSISPDDDTVMFLKQSITDDETTPHKDARAILDSIENYEKSNLRECLLTRLRESGYPVTEAVGVSDPDNKKVLSKQTKEIKLQKALDIFEAKNITWQEAQQLASKWDCNWEDRCALVKAAILDQLPGIDSETEWGRNFIYEIRYENRSIIRSRELFYLLHHPEIALEQQRHTWASIALDNDKFLPDMRSRLQKINALHDLGINQFLDPAASWHKESPELVGLVKAGKRKKNIIALGFAPGSDPVKYLKRLLNLIGFNSACKGQNRIDGEVIRFYSAVPLSPYTDVIDKAISRRFSERAERNENRESEWENLQKKIHKEKPPETTTAQGLEGVTDHPDLLIRSIGAICDGQNAQKTDPEPLQNYTQATEKLQPEPEPQNPQIDPPKVGQKFRYWSPILNDWTVKTVKEVVDAKIPSVTFTDRTWHWLESLADSSRWQPLTQTSNSVNIRGGSTG